MTSVSSPPPPDLAAPPRIRTSNKERDRVASLLDAAVAAGTLTTEEGESRKQVVRGSVYRDELEAPIADLPSSRRTAWRPGGADATPPSVRRALAGLSAAVGAFVARHRVWTLIVVLVVVAGVIAVGFAVWDGHGFGHDGGHGIGHEGAQGAQGAQGEHGG